MRCMVCGSRTINDEKLIFSTMDLSLPKDSLIIISGGAKGVDAIAEKWASIHNVPVEQFKPDWKRYGRGAGIVRNKTMVEMSDFVLIFWDGLSKGTKSDIDFCEKMNKTHLVVRL